MSNEVKDMTCEGKCSNCGECCTSFIPITQEEYKQIKAYLKKHPEIQNEQHFDGKNIHVLCPFRDNKNKKCKIYPVRPYVCSHFICNKSQTILKENKEVYVKNAYYNRRQQNTISMQRLFFKDNAWELAVIFNLMGSPKTISHLMQGMQTLGIYKPDELLKAIPKKKGGK